MGVNLCFSSTRSVTHLIRDTLLPVPSVQFLEEQRQGLAHLTAIVKKDSRDLLIILRDDGRKQYSNRRNQYSNQRR